MIFHSLLSNKKKTVQKGKAGLKILLSSCAIIILLSGIALAADLDVIIGFKKPVGQPEKDLVKSHGGKEKKSFHLIPAISAQLPEDKIEKLKKDPKIAYIEKERIYKAADEYSDSWGVQHIGAQPVHNQNIYGDGVKVAVLDTGIDCNHPDLVMNCRGGYDFVYGDSDPIDYNGHGTHVSGIIAAKNNGGGVVGVAPNSNIYAVSVLSPYGDGQTSWIISGIEWAVDNNMNIATMSLYCDPNPYFPCEDPALHAAVDNAYNSGLLLVAAGGNTNGGEVRYPAAYDSVIAVTATDENNKNAGLSPIGSEIELAAPGINVLSTVPTGSCIMCDPSGYRYASGTSMAVPHVTGVAALIISQGIADVNGDGLKNNIDVRLKLQTTARDLGVPGRDNIYGYGIVDATMAVLGYSAYPDSTDLSITKNDNVDVITAGDGKTYSYTITVKNSGPSYASNVRVSDIWPAMFTRGVVRNSQGSCDTATSSTDFTCDLGTIVKDGTATVTVKYTVSSSTPPGSYTNRAQISSATLDSNTDNNMAEDKNIVEVKLSIARTVGSPNSDAKSVSLSEGSYQIDITTKKLSILDMMVLENGIVQKDLSSTFNFIKSEDASFEINVEEVLEIVFVPYGRLGSTGHVTIGRLS
jgi:subtilisin